MLEVNREKELSYNQHDGVRDRLLKILEISDLNDLTQKQLAERLEISPQFWSKVLNAKKPLGAKLALKLCMMTGTSLDWLLMGNGAMRTVLWRSEDMRLVEFDLTGVPEELDKSLHSQVAILREMFSKKDKPKNK